MFYEIRVSRTNEVLVDELTLDEANELLWYYQDIMGYDVFMTISNHHHIIAIPVIAHEYKSAYIQYFAELQEIGNLI